MTRRGGDPVPLGEALRRFLDRARLTERVEEARAVPEWAERVGPAIAAVATPLRASRGVLVVAVRSSAWLMELKLREPELLERINAGRERGRIRKIRFVLEGP